VHLRALSSRPGRRTRFAPDPVAPRRDACPVGLRAVRVGPREAVGGPLGRPRAGRERRPHSTCPGCCVRPPGGPPQPWFGADSAGGEAHGVEPVGSRTPWIPRVPSSGSPPELSSCARARARLPAASDLPCASARASARGTRHVVPAVCPRGAGRGRNVGVPPRTTQSRASDAVPKIAGRRQGRKGWKGRKGNRIRQEEALPAVQILPRGTSGASPCPASGATLFRARFTALLRVLCCAAVADVPARTRSACRSAAPAVSRRSYPQAFEKSRGPPWPRWCNLRRVHGRHLRVPLRRGAGACR